MNDPNDSNDDWDELAREFALDKPANEGPDEPAPVEGETAELAADAEAETDTEFEDAEEAAGEPGSEGDAATGTGRKRRRRRRRRRKAAPQVTPRWSPARARTELKKPNRPTGGRGRARRGRRQRRPDTRR